MSKQMTPVSPSPSWHPPYDGPGYARERQYLSGIPFKPQRDRHDDLRDLLDKPFRPMRDRRRKGITPRDLRGTLQEMNHLKAAGKYGLLARRFGLGWANLWQALLSEFGLDPFEDPWAYTPNYDYNLAGHGFVLCCKTGNQLQEFAKTRSFRPDGFQVPACSILPTLWCGTSLQPTHGSFGDPLNIPAATGSQWQYDVVFFGPSLVGGSRMNYQERWTRLKRAPFPAQSIQPRRPVFRVPDGDLWPTYKPFEKPKEEPNDWPYPEREVEGGRDLAPYEKPATGFAVPPKGPPVIFDDPHQLLPPGKAPEKKKDFDAGWFGKAYGALTEAADFLECAEKALPPGIPRAPNQMHKRYQRVYDNWELVDPWKLATCLGANAVEDAVIGKANALANKGLARARRLGYLGKGRARGIGFGSWGRRMR